MMLRYFFLILFVLSAASRILDAADPPRYNRAVRDLRCERDASGNPQLVGTVGFHSAKPGMTLSLESFAQLRRGGGIVETINLDIEAQLPAPGSDCAGACIGADEACISYVSGGLSACQGLSFDIYFATPPTPGETFELELVEAPGSQPEIETSDDMKKKEIPLPAVGWDRAVQAIDFRLAEVAMDKESKFEVLVELGMPEIPVPAGTPLPEVDLSVYLQVKKNGEVAASLDLALATFPTKLADCDLVYDTNCDCFVFICKPEASLTTGVSAQPGDRIEVEISPARNAATDPNSRNDALRAVAPELPAAPEWNRRVSNIDYFPSPTAPGNPAICRVVAEVAGSAQNLAAPIDLGTHADLYVNGIRVDTAYALFVGTPGAAPNDCVENCAAVGDDCVSLPNDGFASCGFLIKRFEFSPDVFPGDNITVLVRADGLAVAEATLFDDELSDVVVAKPAPVEESKDPKDAAPPQARFRRGDVDSDGVFDLTDGIVLLEVLFLAGGEAPCEDAADTDDNGVLELTDVIFGLGSLFLGDGPLPAPSSETCGADPTEDALGCAGYDACDKR